MLKVSHKAGFFSCCSVRLRENINFYNTEVKEFWFN
jgi:hypothetical protein